MEPFLVEDEVKTLQNIAARIEGRTAELTRLEDERNPPLSVSAAWDAYERAGGPQGNLAGFVAPSGCPTPPVWRCAWNAVAATGARSSSGRGRISTPPEGGSRRLAALRPTRSTFRGLRDRCREAVDPADLYARLGALGLEYGPA